MLAIVLPTIVAIFAFAFWFRASNTKARYLPDWAYSGAHRTGGLVDPGPHRHPARRRRMDRRAPARSGQGDRGHRTSLCGSRRCRSTGNGCSSIPTRRSRAINTLTVPAGVPLQFELTSASVMNAFFIPQFGSMIYTMNGMTTGSICGRTHRARFKGLSAHFSGDGFSDMHFDVHVVPPEQFSKWAQDASRCRKAARRGQLSARSPSLRCKRRAGDLPPGRSATCFSRSPRRNCRRRRARSRA